jgi:hypothetical protein
MISLQNIIQEIAHLVTNCHVFYFDFTDFETLSIDGLYIYSSSLVCFSNYKFDVLSPSYNDYTWNNHKATDVSITIYL